MNRACSFDLVIFGEVDDFFVALRPTLGLVVAVTAFEFGLDFLKLVLDVDVDPGPLDYAFRHQQVAASILNVVS